MKIENKEIFIPGPSGRIQAKYFKNKQRGAPVALGVTSPPTIWWNDEQQNSL